MNNLTELYDLFIKNGKKIKNFEGWCIEVGKDIFTMLDGEIYKNKTIMTKKEVLLMFKKKGK